LSTNKLYTRSNRSHQELAELPGKFFEKNQHEKIKPKTKFTKFHLPLPGYNKLDGQIFETNFNKICESWGNNSFIKKMFNKSILLSFIIFLLFLQESTGFNAGKHLRLLVAKPRVGVDADKYQYKSSIGGLLRAHKIELSQEENLSVKTQHNKYSPMDQNEYVPFRVFPCSHS
jgi:hypothetical protein